MGHPLILLNHTKTSMSVMISAQYLGDKKVRLVHGPSGCEIYTVPPVDNQGDGSSFSPTDLGAASVVSCMITLVALAAAARQISVVGMCGSVKKHMSSSPRRIARLEIVIRLPEALLDEERQIIERAALTCPMNYSLHPDVEKQVQFVYDVKTQ